ncbi:DUF4142 domain-containing protein [Lentzea sp. BCCO 10_0798]|uniref:DUF4142 domain-containing protein n=1 Tax=Lentzea kristufekii TaxID=3095430 RepID=A0ABU4TZE1_9PSEU|nr:DUF4142 domain-containing protein [Lentzea sp. BCCO 10_0798]MDX8053694.1 DUF4142 domain-containing protein [Lentzea sp. BCCO 10_0798]
MGDSTGKPRIRWLAAVVISLVIPLGAPAGAEAQHDKTGAPAPAPALTGSLPAAPLGSGGKGDEVVETKWGPLGAGDRDFISKVRLAGLWELPAGQQAMQKSQNPKILEAGQHLIDGHTALDQMIRNGGQALGVELPNQPNSDQSGWLTELTNSQGDDYERTFVNRLRAAHGKVYGFAAQIRAGTKNELVRAMAAQTMNTVFDHITVLEKTGLVDFAALPSATVLGKSPPRTGHRLHEHRTVATLLTAGHPHHGIQFDRHDDPTPRARRDRRSRRALALGQTQEGHAPILTGCPGCPRCRRPRDRASLDRAATDG